MDARLRRQPRDPHPYAGLYCRIAEEGIRFENFFCASPVCSPARASILTGTIPSVHGVQDWLRGGNLNMADFPELQGKPLYAAEHEAIPYLQGLTCFTDVLAENGYTCALNFECKHEVA